MKLVRLLYRLLPYLGFRVEIRMEVAKLGRTFIAIPPLYSWHHWYFKKYIPDYTLL